MILINYLNSNGLLNYNADIYACIDQLSSLINETSFQVSGNTLNIKSQHKKDTKRTVLFADNCMQCKTVFIVVNDIL